MKICVIVFAVSIATTVSAQKCDTVEGKIMNCTDINLLKQGYWFEYIVSKILTTDSFNRNPRAFGPHNDRGLVYTPIAEGYYKDNKKIGRWKYYEGFYNDPSAHEKTVVFTDSGFRYEIDTFYHYRFKVSNDTNSLTGQLFLKNDTVNVSCRNGKCKLFNPFKRKTEKIKHAALFDKIRILNFQSYKMRATKKR